MSRTSSASMRRRAMPDRTARSPRDSRPRRRGASGPRCVAPRRRRRRRARRRRDARAAGEVTRETGRTDLGDRGGDRPRGPRTIDPRTEEPAGVGFQLAQDVRGQEAEPIRPSRCEEPDRLPARGRRRRRASRRRPSRRPVTKHRSRSKRRGHRRCARQRRKGRRSASRRTSPATWRFLRCAAESARPVGSGRSHAALVQPAREIAPGVEPRLALGFEEKRVVDVSPVE